MLLLDIHVEVPACGPPFSIEAKDEHTFALDVRGTCTVHHDSTMLLGLQKKKNLAMCIAAASRYCPDQLVIRILPKARD